MDSVQRLQFMRKPGWAPYGVHYDLKYSQIGKVRLLKAKKATVSLVAYNKFQFELIEIIIRLLLKLLIIQ